MNVVKGASSLFAWIYLLSVFISNALDSVCVCLSFFDAGRDFHFVIMKKATEKVRFVQSKSISREACDTHFNGHNIKNAIL